MNFSSTSCTLSTKCTRCTYYTIQYYSLVIDQCTVTDSYSRYARVHLCAPAQLQLHPDLPGRTRSRRFHQKIFVCLLECINEAFLNFSIYFLNFTCLEKENELIVKLILSSQPQVSEGELVKVNKQHTLLILIIERERQSDKIIM